jgi:DNA-binding transcriptional LysR family regulator
MRFDITDLRLFLHVVEEGSITHGADRSHMALASASARIRGMEDALGVPLLARTRRGVEATDAGRTLVHHARLVLNQIEEMRGELGEHAKGLKGNIRLLCNTAALTEFLPEALGAFMSAHPNINIDLEERLSHDIVQAIAGGLADIGIVADSVDLNGLETIPFRRDRLVVVAANDHPLLSQMRGAKLHTIDFEKTLDFDFIGLAGESALQQYLTGQAVRLGRRIKYRIRLRSFDSICRMVENGIGIGIVPEAAAMRARESMSIRCLPLADSWAERQLTICMRRNESLPVFTRELVESIRAWPEREDGSAPKRAGRAKSASPKSSVR